MELIVERRNLKLPRNINTEYLVCDNTALFLVDVWGASNDENIKDIPMEDNETWKVLGEIDSDNGKETFCYIKLRTLNDGHKQHKTVYIPHIIVDEIAVAPKVFKHIFSIFFRQEADTNDNRLVLGNKEYEFSRDSCEVANDVAIYVCGLFSFKQSE